MLREESWYEELAKDGVDPDSSTQSEFLAWQVKQVCFVTACGMLKSLCAERAHNMK